MSERTYFSFRYAIPGYTFLSMILLINIEFFITYIKQISDTITLFGIILGFFTLLSGSAIGFIISQIWYSIYNYIIKSHRMLMRREVYRNLTNIIDDLEGISNPVTVMVYFLQLKLDKNVAAYITRLFDMFHSLGSTFFGILLGLFLGYTLRKWTTQIFWKNHDFYIMGFSMFFLIVIYFNSRKVLKENDSMINLMLDLKGEEFVNEIRHTDKD